MALRALRLACCVEDLRMLARARVPKPFYDYVDAGSWSEATYQVCGRGSGRRALPARRGGGVLAADGQRR